MSSIIDDKNKTIYVIKESVGGKNKSALHWDLIKDMKNGSTVYADDKLIYKDGKHLL